MNMGLIERVGGIYKETRDKVETKSSKDFKKWLEGGYVVLGDRFWTLTYAYNVVLLAEEEM